MQDIQLLLDARRMSGVRRLRFFDRRAGRDPAPAFPGGDRRGVTPVPMPNTAVKPSTADGTARETVWESRSLPGFFFDARDLFEVPGVGMYGAGRGRSGSGRAARRTARRLAAAGEWTGRT